LEGPPAPPNIDLIYGRPPPAAYHRLNNFCYTVLIKKIKLKEEVAGFLQVERDNYSIK
jgi:hypothetical protein